MGGLPGWGPDGEGPTYAEDTWDIVWIAGRPLPGTCKIDPGSVARLNIDKGKSKGVDGARLTVTGYDPGVFSVLCEVMPGPQWDALQDVIDQVWTRPKKKARITEVAVQIHHPALQAVHITEAALINVVPPADGSAEGFKVVRFQLQESVQPSKKNAIKTAKSAAPGVVPVFKKGEEPQNATPPKPSTNKKTLSSRGQPAKPEEGVS